MQASTNPFNPGSGLRPPALVGRGQELEALTVLVTRVKRGMPGRGIMLSGLRGVGKTVLLNEMRGYAEGADWFVVGLEARGDGAGSTSVRKILARDISATARRISSRKKLSDVARQALETVSAFSVKVGASGIDLGVELKRGRGDSGDVEVDLPELVQDLCLALNEEHKAFGIFIDEMQDVDDELLRALLVAQHQAGQRGRPFYVIGAGLPHLPGRLADVRSYAERLFDYRTISQLPMDAAAQAVAQPIRTEGADIDDAALDVLFEASGGFPYFLHEYGRATWEVSAGPTISAADAQLGIAVGLERLDAGFFSSRWNRATKSERRMLIAMAANGDEPAASSDVARRMGLKPTSLGPYRASLIGKGLIYAPDHGKLAYTVPNMAAFVDRHREDLA